MQATMQLGFEQELRHTQKVVGLISWTAGVVLAIFVAWQSGHIRHRGVAADQASFVDWSVEGTGDPVEVNGAVVMPEDRVVSHRPASGAAERQKP
jgi:hypothetical protein